MEKEWITGSDGENLKFKRQNFFLTSNKFREFRLKISNLLIIGREFFNQKLNCEIKML